MERSLKSTRRTERHVKPHKRGYEAKRALLRRILASGRISDLRTGDAQLRGNIVPPEEQAVRSPGPESHGGHA